MERLRQKVAWSSSRVLASLQQVARHPSLSECSTASSGYTGAHQQQAPQDSANEASARDAQEASQQDSAASQLQAANSALSAQATAHLTEEERGILLEVFRKEEQFQRETIRQMRSQLASGCSAASGEQRAPPRPASSAAASGPTPAHPTRPASATGAAAGAEKQQQAAPRQCRICRKLMGAQEPAHLCSACRQFVCDDCASYSSSHQLWSCSSCRRRATQPGIPAEALRELGLSQNSSAVRRMTLRLNRAELRAGQATPAAPPPAPPPASPGSQPHRSPLASAALAAQVDAGRPKAGPTKRQPEPLPGSRRRPSQAPPAADEAGSMSPVATHAHQPPAPSAPQTLVTASSDQAVGPPSAATAAAARAPHSLRRDSSSAALLIPIPSDQIHLRRLSDQSNLMRRSSILAASATEGLAIQRNRSHSEINAHPANFLWSGQQQHQPASSHLFNQLPSNYLYEQQQQHQLYFRRMSDQQQQQQQLQYHQRHLVHRSSQSQLQALVTPYSQKLRYSSEEMRSDSGSDLDAAATGDLQPSNSYQHHIPSVSVSEFRSSQQHQHQQQLLRDQQEALLRQRQAAQQHRFSLFAASEAAVAAHLAARRGSSGRLLPRIPDDHSRSLLELPAHMRADSSSTEGRQAGSHSGSRLDLPSLSPTIRRASAPEGQNIKIVVDDMDGSLKPHGLLLLTRQGQLYERLVLYRDHSLAGPGPLDSSSSPAPPSSSTVGNAARAFGLHVTGGKILPADQAQPGEYQLQACVSWTLPGGPADKVGLRPGDRIVEWDGKCLVNMTYEQVAEVIESSGNIAELVVRPLAGSPNRSQRRLSQQTERQSEQRRSGAAGHQVLDGPLPAAHHSPNHRNSQQQQLRRLPQIPPAAAANLELAAGQQHQQQLNSSSLGHLEQTHLHHQLTQLAGNGRRDPMRNCLSARHEQQSRSANELAPAHAPNARQPYSASNSPSKVSTAAAAAAANDYWLPQQAQATNGYHQLQAQQFGAAHQLAARPHQMSANDSHEFYGLIGLQVSVDEPMAQLEFSILAAIDVPANPCLEYQVRVRILPDSHRFKPCYTHPSSDMNWKETFIFQDFPTQQIHRMSLEVSIWVHEDATRLAAQPSQPICETLIPIQSACEHNTDFWPLHAPTCSPTTRRKSLNDLIETSRNDMNSHLPLNFDNQPPSYLQQQQQQQQPLRPMQSRESRAATPSRKSQLEARVRRDELPIVRSKERSGSNKNLPSPSKFLSQARRASDEAMATSNSYRLSARLSPAQSRRAISVTNVGVDGPTFSSRPSSRLGSQSNIGVSRKFTGDGIPLNVSRHNSPGSTNLSSPTSQMSAVGTTPTGRRSSLVGIQSMSGYRSQKNSQSGSTDYEQPGGGGGRSSVNQKRSTQLQQQRPAGRDSPRRRPNDPSMAQTQQQHQQPPLPPPVTTREQQLHQQYMDSAASSRRESSEQSTPPLERKRSFAALTFRKLKRTMSLNKGAEGDSKTGSRRSSSSSNQSNELVQDAGVSRRLMGNQACVGRLKLALVMTKGQLELEVICAESLRINKENVLGIYVKVYLLGASRSNKRKTRAVQASEAPVFKQLIKYDGSLVDNKSLEVSMWQRQGNLKGKSPIGYTIIRLAELKLDQLHTVWYSLRPMDTICSSSFEDS